ncbi:helix-turn-helix transcriptional regulator [Lactobacillus alvi]|uniref:Helix-turn-helix transcriptional regulator n=1 Tax=Limosilactobacillus alvi TaxID=990412 RepID=A0ABS2EPW4_9LACO|nr:helix-turn-helix transcriptional regulator [Limosilactobacillus alvi]MBM6754438.1 helix-turn-helix transcriptional regulator [Limosilactobacillus alvi]
MSAFGERIQQLREERGWSKTYVAQKLGLKRMQVYANYEYGTREPDLDTIKKLALLFDVTTDYLLGKKQSESSPVNDLTVDEAIGTIMSYDGKPVTEHDHEVMRRLMRAYLEGRDN